MPTSTSWSVGKTVFCFWEPAGAMPAYLRLCMQTWTRHLHGGEVVVLDSSNLDRYLRAGTYDMRALRLLNFSKQKDAIQLAVLEQHGGIFMDVDTLITGDITPIVEHLAGAEVVLFNVFMGFMAARPHARLLTRVVDNVRQRLARLREQDLADLAWGFAGNDALADEMAAMVSETTIGRAYHAIERAQRAWPGPLRAAWQRAIVPRWTRGQRLLFGASYSSHLHMVRAQRYGFIAEPGGDSAGVAARYRQFWFEETPVEALSCAPNQRVIALHHSATPDWYSALDAEDILKHDCRLSKTLRSLLPRRPGSSTSSAGAR